MFTYVNVHKKCTQTNLNAIAYMNRRVGDTDITRRLTANKAAK